MRWAVFAAIAALLAVGALWLFASRLPATVSASREAVLPAPVDKVFALVADVGNQHRWRRDVDRIDVSEEGSDWTEHLRRGGAIRFRVEQTVPNRLFDISYASSLGFSGRWVGTFVARDVQTTLVRIEESTTTPSPLTRILARLFAPPGSHADLYLEDLEMAARQSAGTN